MLICNVDTNFGLYINEAELYWNELQLLQVVLLQSQALRNLN